MPNWVLSSGRWDYWPNSWAEETTDDSYDMRRQTKSFVSSKRLTNSWYSVRTLWEDPTSRGRTAQTGERVLSDSVCKSGRVCVYVKSRDTTQTERYFYDMCRTTNHNRIEAEFTVEVRRLSQSVSAQAVSECVRAPIAWADPLGTTSGARRGGTRSPAEPCAGLTPIAPIRS